ncbi:3-hydroxyacyl-CoA dehydrogenase NAD-binding domain-containing protein [Aliikangiella sp. G2MR2-5]|uniref:3-hydroxyacyl-CoA dehydrogenase NAD-binding domain-containing protein n=1 Tax=Aliikangiella sp. G2MR2-5 TaxID=2788943 RepID=UPI0018AAD0E2|nr:3-hydroxyacyl-CoA dehydrogenase NAD-binding domain-containing protein [Aliikangiella sp. G2MR2-5]
MANSEINSVNLIEKNSLGIIEIDYAPVNALSQGVRQGIVDGIEKFEASGEIKAIIIRCKSRTFIAGADIKEFGKPPTEPFLPDVVNRIENCNTPVIASLFGTSLGGGFEVALACHYRVALESAKVGLPEVNLGLIPGAGGTQRLPRVVGVGKALEMVTNGKHYRVNELSSTGLIDKLFPVDADLDEATESYVEELISSGQLVVKRVGEKSVETSDIDWDQEISNIKRKARGKDAPVVAAEVIRKSLENSIENGMKFEREAFLKLRESEQSAALRYAFAIERAAGKTDLTTVPLEVNNVGVIGAGNMGSGIATAFLTSGFQVQLIEQTAEALAAGMERIEKNLSSNVKRGRMSQSQFEECLSRVHISTEYESLSGSDLVIEAIFENIDIKKSVFSKLDSVTREDCILATNTSYLDINEIASVVNDPPRVIGMHFFSPANIMKLLEVVRAEKSSELALATAMSVGKKLGKMSVLVGVCFGFAGNRMYTRYGREIQQMLLEGASIEQIDKAMTNWGMAMGPLAVQDLSGIDIGHNARSAQPFPEHDPGYFRAAATMVENGRLGRKTGMGFYRYDEEGKKYADEAAESLIRTKATELGIQLRTFEDEEIVDRAILALISEGLALFKEGIVQRISDIDVIWLHGYGFPRHKGGPIFQAKQMGKLLVEQKLDALRDKESARIWPQVELSILNS